MNTNYFNVGHMFLNAFNDKALDSETKLQFFECLTAMGDFSQSAVINDMGPMEYKECVLKMLYDSYQVEEKRHG